MQSHIRGQLSCFVDNAVHLVHSCMKRRFHHKFLRKMESDASKNWVYADHSSANNVTKQISFLDFRQRCACFPFIFCCKWKENASLCFSMGTSFFTGAAKFGKKRRIFFQSTHLYSLSINNEAHPVFISQALALFRLTEVTSTWKSVPKS